MHVTITMPGERLLIGQREREISVLLPRGRTSLVRTCRWWRVYVTLGACVCTVNGAARGTDSTELITDLCKMLFRWTRRINKLPFSKLVNRRRIYIYIYISIYYTLDRTPIQIHSTMERIVETGLAIAIRDSLVIGGGVNGRRGRRLRGRDPCPLNRFDSVERSSLVERRYI